MVQTDADRHLRLALFNAFDEEQLEFLKEMIEPEIVEGEETLKGHQEETLVDVDDIEAYTNNMGRQKRRMEFLRRMHASLESLERSDSD